VLQGGAQGGLGGFGVVGKEMEVCIGIKCPAAVVAPAASSPPVQPWSTAQSSPVSAAARLGLHTCTFLRPLSCSLPRRPPDAPGFQHSTHKHKTGRAVCAALLPPSNSTQLVEEELHCEHYGRHVLPCSPPL
jgi:hypothetical protein